MFCNTNSLKLFLLSLVMFSACITFADGVCHIEQDATGKYTINCTGDGLQVHYSEITNEVYIIQNCESLKQELSSSVSAIRRACSEVISHADQVVDNCEDAIYQIGQLKMYTSDIPEPYIVSELNSIESKVQHAKASGQEAAKNANNTTAFLDFAQSQIDGIECGTCDISGGEGGEGSCCNTDLSGIEDLLNTIVTQLDDITSVLGDVESTLTSQNAAMRYRRAYIVSGPMQFSTSSIYKPADNTVASFLSTIERNTQFILPSINNWLANISEQQIKPVYHSLFAGQQSPLYFYEPAKFDNNDGTHNFYSYLTNFYVEVARGESKSQLTNWFARVEALLASLVLPDNKSTNTVDRSFGESEKTRFHESLQSLSSGPSSTLDQVNDVGQGIVQSLTTIHNSLSRFGNSPSTVSLVKIGEDVDIGFESSSITYLINACRCVTTLIWTFGGLWLLFVFVYWCFKQSYNLVVFCYGVCSAIFGGGAK